MHAVCTAHPTALLRLLHVLTKAQAAALQLAVAGARMARLES
jgi:hypothetical protein